MSRRKEIPGTLDCPAIPGLTILPVVRYRLAFARAAAQQVRTTKPGTVIAADLPHPLTHSDWLRAALGAFPKPSTFMIHRSPHTYAAPIVANDAACLALETAIEVGHRYYCVDDRLPAEPPDPGGELPHDESLPPSLESYFSTALSDLPGGANILPAGKETPGEIYTLSATRCAHGVTCPGIDHDIASAIGLAHTGPQSGPERYQAVAQSGRPVPRVDPSADPEIAGFELLERNIAFCIKYATDAVLLAHFQGFQLTAKLEKYATERGVQIIRMPLSVLPRYLQTAIQRRIFLSKTMRWHELGERIADRMVFWRIPDPTAPRHRWGRALQDALPF